MKSLDDAKKLVEKWAKAAGLDEDNVKKLMQNEQILNEAKNSLAMQDEMASGIDRAKNEADSVRKEMKTWYETIGLPAHTEAQRIKAVNERYRQQFGEIDVSGPVGDGNGSPKFVKREDLDAMATSGVQVAKQLAYITSDYNYRFGSKYGPMTPEQLDEFEKFAVSRGRPPIEAYREWVRPKDEEIKAAQKAAEEASVEARIKAAREEGYREGQTRTQWGAESTKTTDVFGRDLEAIKAAKASPEDADRAGDKAFLEAWTQWDQEHASASR